MQLGAHGCVKTFLYFVKEIANSVSAQEKQARHVSTFTSVHMIYNQQSLSWKGSF